MRDTSDATIHDDRKLPALTGVRFFAAVSVLLSHFTERGIVSVPSEFIRFLDGGRTAVSLFFVLSGFILTFNYVGITRHLRKQFYVNRIARILPVVLLALAIAAAGVAVAVLNPGRGYLASWYALKGFDPVALVVSFVAQATMTTGWLPAARLNQPWNGPAWSISCEMFFYALFPFVIAYLRKVSALRLTHLLGAAFFLQCLFIVAVRAAAPIEQRGFLVSQFPVTHLFEFVAGVAAGLWFLRGGRDWAFQGSRRVWMLAGSLIPLVVISWLKPVDPAFLPLTPFFAVLVLALAVQSKRRSWLAWGPLVVLGEASFSLYLIHIPLLNLASLLDPTGFAGWVLMAGMVGLSVVVFKTFESPSRRLVKRLMGTSPDRIQTARVVEPR